MTSQAAGRAFKRQALAFITATEVSDADTSLFIDTIQPVLEREYAHMQSQGYATFYKPFEDMCGDMADKMRRDPALARKIGTMDARDIPMGTFIQPAFAAAWREGGAPLAIEVLVNLVANHNDLMRETYGAIIERLVESGKRADTLENKGLLKRFRAGGISDVFDRDINLNTLKTTALHDYRQLMNNSLRNLPEIHLEFPGVLKRLATEPPFTTMPFDYLAKRGITLPATQRALPAPGGQ